MTREQFDDTFSLFQLSEIMQSTKSNSQLKKLLKFYKKNLFFPVEEDYDGESIKMIRPYFD